MIPGVDLVVDFTAADGRHIVQDFEPWLVAGSDLSDDMERASAKIAWAGAVLGLAQEVEMVLDAEYHQWRADEGERILSMSEKASEWKIKQLVDSSPKFAEYKRCLAHCEAVVRKAEMVVRALSDQAAMLRSRGANRREEMRSIGMSISDREVDEMSAENRKRDEAREEAVAAVFKRTENRRRY